LQLTPTTPWAQLRLSASPYDTNAAAQVNLNSPQCISLSVVHFFRNLAVGVLIPVWQQRQSPTMALLQYRYVVDYAAQQAAFEDFLENFKTSPQDTITHAIGQISIDDDDLSDEYDFMDEDDNAHEQRRREKAAQKQPKHKYADVMQKLANRAIDEVLIELDDLASVRFLCSLYMFGAHANMEM
jgi:hypothetical protein